MSTIEISPQKQKTYDGRKQDHGDAASRKGHDRDFFDRKYDSRGIVKKDAEQLRAAFDDTAYGSMTPAQLEAEADKILNGGGGGVYTSETPRVPHQQVEVSEDVDDEDIVDSNQDGFLTEADLGIRSRHEVAKLMAKRATLDPAFERDDFGDSDYESPIRIRTRL